MATNSKDNQNKKKGRDDPPPLRLHLDKRAGELAAVAHDGSADDDLLTTLQVASWFGVSQDWLEIGRVKKYGPPFLRLAPQIVRYKRSDVVAWLKERKYIHTAGYPDDDGDRRRRTKAGARP